jgi:hypothetical protein
MRLMHGNYGDISTAQDKETSVERTMFLDAGETQIARWNQRKKGRPGLGAEAACLLRSSTGNGKEASWLRRGLRALRVG